MLQTLAPLAPTLDAPSAEPVADCGMPAGPLPLPQPLTSNAGAPIPHAVGAPGDAPTRRTGTHASGVAISPTTSTIAPDDDHRHDHFHDGGDDATTPSSTDPSSCPHQPSDDRPSPTEPDPTEPEMPLRDRIWHRFCSGASYSAIAQQLHLDRQTVTRHVRAVQQLLAADEHASLALVRMRAVEAQFQILAATWDAYHTECQREDDYYASLASPAVSPAATLGAPQPAVPLPLAAASGRGATRPYRAHRARLLSLAATIVRTTARLEGLFDHPAAASADDSLNPSADASADASTSTSEHIAPEHVAPAIPSPSQEDPMPASPEGPIPAAPANGVASCGMPDSSPPPDALISPDSACGSVPSFSSSSVSPSCPPSGSLPSVAHCASEPSREALGAPVERVERGGEVDLDAFQVRQAVEVDGELSVQHVLGLEAEQRLIAV